MIKQLISGHIVFAIVLSAVSQSTIDSVLRTISANNKTILAEQQNLVVQKSRYKTGLTPDDPVINYDYMIGSPVTAGDQTDITITQAFDFPTVYIRKKNISGLLISRAEFHFASQRQEILFLAQKACIELVYRNRLHIQLALRKLGAEKLLSDFKARLITGEGNVLDVGKAQLQLIETNKHFQNNLSSISRLNQQLTQSNGGKIILFTDTIYALISPLPAFEQLEGEIESMDPVRKSLEKEKLLSQQQLELSKVMWLPKFEAGYHYQGILGQRFNGFHAGITIPIWQNSYSVRTQKANLLLTDLNLADHGNEHYYEIKQLYEKYNNLRITLGEYERVFNSLGNIALLNKALQAGQISTIDYFLEQSYYYNFHSGFLETEMELHMVLAELLKHKL